MTKEQYEALEPNERLMFDEMFKWSGAVNSRLDALTSVVKKLLEVATSRP
jgi:hypothetical protein